MPARRLLALGLLMAAGFAMAACRAEEQGRALWQDKGHYAGKPDTPHPPQLAAKLQERLKMGSY
jgi:hypothetical protein